MGRNRSKYERRPFRPRDSFPQINKEEVARMVKKGLEAQFETYSWDQMIDDLPLTPEEKAWAKKHTTYAVKVES